jgi:hypothetical protein
MALAYPLTSETGNLTSIAASGDLLYLFGTALRMTTDLATIKIESNEIDVTQATGSAINMMEKFQGLRTGTVDFSGIFPRTTPPLGISALVTYASGYVAYMNALTIDITWPEIEITETTGAATGWRKWMPGGIGSWSGSYTCKADVNDAPSLPTSGASATASFKLVEAGSDPTLSGNIGIPSLSQRVRLGDFSELSYAFNGSGNLNQTNGGLLAASGDISKPTWNIAGTSATPDQTCRLTVGGSRKWEFPAFWTKLSLSWKMDDVVRVTGTLRIASTATAS